MSKKSAVSFPPQDKSSGFHSTQLMKNPAPATPLDFCIHNINHEAGPAMEDARSGGHGGAPCGGGGIHDAVDDAGDN